MASQKPSPIGAKSGSLSVPQDELLKSNPSNGLVERLRRFADACAVAKSQDDSWVGDYMNGDDGDVAADIRELLRASSQRGESELSAEDDAYEIGKRDGYEEAVQSIDLLTGGDGEYRFCTDGDPDRHTPDAAAMMQRIVDRQRGENRSANAAETFQAALNASDAFWTDDVLNRTEEWVNEKCNGDADVRSIAAALLAALRASPATPIGGLSLGVEGDQGVSVAGLPSSQGGSDTHDNCQAGKED